MNATQNRRTGRKGRNLLSICSLCLAAILIVLVYTSIAPAISAPSLVSQAVPTFDAGGDHSLAIGTNGTLWAWGDNYFGQLGDGSIQDRSEPTWIVTTQTWMTVSAGWRHSLGITTDGAIWAWGWNDFGQLGDGTWDDRHEPTRLQVEGTWKAVAAGRDHSLAIRSDGSLWGWGCSTDGQVGSGDWGYLYVPTRVGSEKNWAVIAAGDCFSAAIKTDGSLWTWGANQAGQLGNGTNVKEGTPKRVGEGTDWVAVACGGAHMVALKADGSLWAWGLNHVGQVGDGSTTNRWVPTRIGTGSSWAAVSAGFWHSLAVKTDGSIWAWGRNADGQLGDGTKLDRNVPVSVSLEGATGWVAVAAGGSHSLALHQGRNIFGWGKNLDGQVGDGTRDGRTSPIEALSDVQIPAPTTTTVSTTTTTLNGSTTTTTHPSTTTTTTGLGFTDVAPSHPYYEAITGLGARGIVSGYSDHTFHPNDPVLRKQFAKMIVGAMDLRVSENDWQDTSRPFSDCGPDVATDLYPHDFIAVAKAHGLTQGKTATTFAPDDKITRAQMVTMVVRAAKNMDVPLRAVGADYNGTFKKYNDAAHGANVKLAEYNGLLEGLQVPGSPAAWIMGTATRGEVSQILWNLMGLIEG
jgi:alpha-tubulin suppressor-like RCC1 family protein